MRGARLVWCLLMVLLLAMAVPSPAAVVVKLHKASTTKDTMEHIQKARDMEEKNSDTQVTPVTFEKVADSHVDDVMADSVVNTTVDPAVASFLQLSDNGPSASLKSKKFGFKTLEYFGDVTINKQSFSMLFDTSTPHTWVPSASCVTCCHPGKFSLPPTTSVGSQGGVPMFEQFPDGTWYSGVSQSGTLGIGDEQDQLAVPHFSFYQLFVKGHRYGLVKQDEEDCSDAIIGLGFSSSSHDAVSSHALQPPSQRSLDALERQAGVQMSFIDRLHHDHLMTSPVFTMYLTNEEDGSTLEFGNIDHSRVSHKLNPNGLFYLSAVGFPDFFWAFNVPRVCIDDDCFRVGNIPARISSSVPYIALPNELYKAFRKPQERVPNPCHILKHLPTLTLITIGSDSSNPSHRYPRRLELCPKDYVIVGDDGTCDFAVVPSNYPVIVLGTPFMRKFFSVFDIEQKRIGLGQSTEFCREEVKREVPVEALMKLAQDYASQPDKLADGLKKLVADEKEDTPPPLLRDNVYLTYHKKFLN